MAKDLGIEDLVDIDLFIVAKRLEDSLLSHSCVDALAWCNENKSNLKKNKSTLEFNLRIQEYVELVRSLKISEAISYGKKHFPSWMETHSKEIQQATALLAFSPTTRCAVYRVSPPNLTFVANPVRNIMMNQDGQPSFHSSSLTITHSTRSLLCPCLKQPCKQDSLL